MSARYAFPTQASRVVKSQVKIPPRSAVSMSGLSTSSKGRVIQIVLPAQGYLNPLESYLRFDLTLSGVPAGVHPIRPINSIHSMFRRLRVLYGSLVLEDIQNYATLMRMLVNVAVTPTYQNNSGVILEGMGSDAVRSTLHHVQRTPGQANKGGVAGTDQTAAVDVTAGSGTQATRITWSADGSKAQLGTAVASSTDNTTDPVLITHTYCLNLCSGILTQQKLIPLKWLANQLTIELELEEPAAFLVAGYTSQESVVTGTVATDGVLTAPKVFTTKGLSNDTIPQHYKMTSGHQTAAGATPTIPNLRFALDNIYYVAELLEFDSTYDAAFYQGMLAGGVPLKFASWHGFYHNLAATDKQTLVLQERSRSIKAAFTVIRSINDVNLTNLNRDALWFYAGDAKSSDTADVAAATYVPTAIDPTDTSAVYLDEFQWRIGGRYFPSQPVKCSNGGTEPLIELQKALNTIGDYTVSSGLNVRNWFVNRGAFTVSGEFEATNGEEMSGVNAEELADLALQLNYNKALTSTAMAALTFVHYDAMVIIRPNNVVELVM